MQRITAGGSLSRWALLKCRFAYSCIGGELDTVRPKIISIMLQNILSILE